MNTPEPLEPSSRKEKEPTLFLLPASASAEPEPAGRPRLRRAERQQVVMHVASLDSLLPEDHRARWVWEYAQGLDLGALYEPIRAVEGTAGRDATDPRILLALWLYATVDGVGSARQLARLCEDHVAYRWICGGVSVNYHTLSDFRTAHPAFLDELLTQSVATLMQEGLVTLHRVAQDGMRVRASAGAASFRRRATLEECQTQARSRSRRCVRKSRRIRRPAHVASRRPVSVRPGNGRSGWPRPWGNWPRSRQRNKARRRKRRGPRRRTRKRG